MAEIRTIDYKGFNFATGSGGSPGFLIYSGSLELGSDVSSITSYTGVGIEAIGSSESFLRFRTVPNELDIRASQFFVGTEAAQFVSGSGGNIEISSSNFHLKPDGGLIIGGDTVINASLSTNELFTPAGTNKTNARSYISSSGEAGFAGDGSGNYKVTLDGTGTSTIGGWTIGDDRLTGNNIIISSSGAIQTADFVSSIVGGLAGSGYRIGADGIAEFEEARVRGTLSTAVFEKETVSAVGGALIVANATALKSGSLILSGSIATASVDNAAGFVAGEYILAKATSSTGFTEEIMKIHSVNTSDNTMVVSRSMNGNLIQSMSSGQVLVSQGSNGTGYILLNATSGSDTPYIDIVERTGTDVNDISTKVRLGDLTGINDDINGTAVSGFGLYTDNVFLKGGIEASYGTIGAWKIVGNTIKTFGNTFELNGGVSGNGIVISSSNFKVTGNGVISASSANFSGDILATNITENLVRVTDDNSGSFLRYVSGNAITGKKNLVCDGSLGGEITNNMEINTTAAFIIADIELANTGSLVSNIDIFINTEGMELSDGDGVITELRQVLETKDAP